MVGRMQSSIGAKCSLILEGGSKPIGLVFTSDRGERPSTCTYSMYGAAEKPTVGRWDRR